MASSSRSPQAPPWVELPEGITEKILQKLGAFEILCTAQRVCTTWRRLCKDPSMWRVIDMRFSGIAALWELENYPDKICIRAVDLSQGNADHINIEYFGSDSLLNYIALRSSQLKRLQLAFCYNVSAEGMTDDGLLTILNGCSRLESLDMRQCFNLRFGDIAMKIYDSELNFPYDIYDTDSSYDSDYAEYGWLMQ
nr:putative F-box/LRR-repeat protein 23 [Ipomoea batatas]